VTPKIIFIERIYPNDFPKRELNKQSAKIILFLRCFLDKAIDKMNKTLIT